MTGTVINIPVAKVETAPLSELMNPHPSRVVILRNAEGLYGCWFYNGFHGIAGFDSFDNPMIPEIKVALLKASTQDHIFAEEVSFDEALDIAKSRPVNLHGLIYFSSNYQSRKFYVR